MSKLKKRILITVIVLVLLVILIPAIGIRLAIRKHAQEITPALGPTAEYFTEYDESFAATDDTQTLSHGGMTLTAPGYFAEEETSLENTSVYSHAGENGTVTESIVFMAPYDQSDMNLFSEENMEQFTNGFLDKYAANQLKKGFEKLGNGIPDNAYHTEKCIVLLSEDDYSFWDWKQGFAYVVCGILKRESMWLNYHYVYETEDTCGIIRVRDFSKDGKQAEKGFQYYIIADLYSTDDLNTVHGLLIRCNSLETAYAIINSVVIE